jgi:hypothetical protein
MLVATVGFVNANAMEEFTARSQAGVAVVAAGELVPVDRQRILYVCADAPVTFQDALHTALLAMVPQENGWVPDVLSGVDVVMSK